MVSSTAQTIAKENQLGQLSRTARALIGWIEPKEAQLLLAGRVVDRVGQPAYVEQVKLAHEAVSQRPTGVDQAEVLLDVPKELLEYVAAFQATEAAATYFSDGWAVKVADLAKVCALQPVVFMDHARERAAAVDEGNLVSAARVSLPLPGQDSLPLQFDSQRNTWMISSRNPNLKLVGHISQPIKNAVNAVACGFLVAVVPSFVQVVEHRDRFLLRDGYHRSLGLLARGIRHVPVLFKAFSPYSDLGLGPGMLPGDAYLGDRPPLLADYLDDAVSTELQLPASQKMVVIQGLEMTPIG